MAQKIQIYDTTLRDGAQTEGISYSLHDKVNIVKRLDAVGVDFIEGGWPFSNPKDTELFAHFKKNKLKNSKLVPFGSTARFGRPAAQDQNLQSLVKSGTEYVTIFGKTWDLHVKSVLKVSLEDNLKLIADSVTYLIKQKRKVFYDAEHFFDGYKANPDYAIKCIKAALGAGAKLIVFCDTNGGTLPWEVEMIAAQVKKACGMVSFGIHCHNDLGLSLANSLAAVRFGCVQVQGTVNGCGERCGNTDIVAVMGTLKLKMKAQFAAAKNLKELTELSYFVSEVGNVAHRENSPFVGRSAFAHKAGVHIDAMLKNPLAYEHMDPALVGNHRRFLVSELAGKSSLVVKAKELDYDLDKKSPRAQKLHELIQNLEKQGYQFEAAEGSFKLLLKREFNEYRKFFDLLGFRVSVEKREDNRLISEAAIKLKVGKELKHTAAEGDGPVNALDNALRKALVDAYPQLASMRLCDFKVRVLDAKEGTAAKVRVLIESQDDNETWTTVGVSENIIEASWQALVDSVEYKLLKPHKFG